MAKNDASGAGEQPKVTLVVPAYNHEGYIEECLASILSQDYPALEVIIINDGSTDATGERIEAYLAANKQDFKYISKKNEGLLRTLNIAIEMATGQYFCELASDDLLLPASISERVAFMQSRPELDMAFADCLIMKGREKTEERLIKRKDGERVGYDSAMHSVVDFINRDARIFFPTGIFTVEILKRLGGFDEEFRFCEDTFMRYKMALEAVVGYNDIPVMYYRHHGTNVSRGNPLRLMPEKILALEKLLPLVGDDKIRSLIKEKLFKYNLKYFRLGKAEGIGRDKLMGTLDSALKCKPSSLKVRYMKMKL